MPNGTCQDVCGLDVSGSCSASGDCAACTLAATCQGGPPGTCGPTGAAGCDELGAGGVAVLPDPWNQFTQICGSSGDCSSVEAPYNIGAALRALTGNNEIGDGNVQHGMPQCAGVDISGAVSCGICVPCLSDADCEDIDVSGAAIGAQLFGPPGSLAAELLQETIFGGGPRVVPMYCETAGVGYGACTPCPSLHSDCSAN